MKFDRPTMMEKGKDLQRTDRHGLPLMSKVQTVWTVCLEPALKSMVLCRVTAQGIGLLGVVDGEMGA